MKKLLDILKKAVSTVTGWIKSNGIEGVLGLLAGCVLWIMGYKIWAGFSLGVFATRNWDLLKNKVLSK
tara:strand:- start:75 stop:278 length:204 start_codon:yes stop_codon:yes gene_type:complete